MKDLPVLGNEQVRLIQPTLTLELISKYASILNEPQVMAGIGALEKMSEGEVATKLKEWRENPLQMHWFIQLNEKGLWTPVGDVNLDYLRGYDKDDEELLALESSSIARGAEIKVVVSGKYENRHIATLATGAAIKYGFEKRGIDEVYAFIYEDNPSSLRVFEKLGFAKRGFKIEPKTGRKDGIFRLDKSVG